MEVVCVTFARTVMQNIETIAPPSLAEPWDNCGLQAGDPSARTGRVLVALTPLPEVFDEAEEKEADFLLFHHPLIFGGLESVDISSYPGGLLAWGIRSGLTAAAGTRRARPAKIIPLPKAHRSAAGQLLNHRAAEHVFHHHVCIAHFARRRFTALLTVTARIEHPALLFALADCLTHTICNALPTVVPKRCD